MNLTDTVSAFRIAETEVSASRMVVPQSNPRPSTPRTPTIRRTGLANPGAMPESSSAALCSGTIVRGDASSADCETF